LGFGGQSPIIQTTGKVRYLTDEPRKLIESGNYHTEAHLMFGANEGEGIMALDMTLNLYIRPNDLENDTNFWKYDAVRVVMGALGNQRFSSPSTCCTIRLSHNLFQVSAMTTKYLGYAVD
jgi:acetylcholinesterase